MAFPAPVVELPDCQLNWESMQSIVDTYNTRLSIGLYMAGDIKVTFAIVAPTGWILLTGQTINPIQTLFPDLAAAMGVTGSITFPDCRGRAIIGAGPGAGLTSRTIRTTGGNEPSNMPSHIHNTNGTTNGSNQNLDHSHGTPGGQNFLIDGAGGSAFNAGGNYNITSNTGGMSGGPSGVNAHTHNVNINTGLPLSGDTTHDNMMPYVVANIMLRTANN